MVKTTNHTKGKMTNTKDGKVTVREGKAGGGNECAGSITSMRALISFQSSQEEFPPGKDCPASYEVMRRPSGNARRRKRE